MATACLVAGRHRPCSINRIALISLSSGTVIAGARYYVAVSADDQAQAHLRSFETRIEKLEASENRAAQRDLRLLLFAELAEGLRARKEPEHLYTAAALGGFGAVAWGVAALQPRDYIGRPVYERPAAVAAIGILLVATAVVAKIWREHTKYAENKDTQNGIASDINATCGGEIIPQNMRMPAGSGWAWSIMVVIVAAFAAIAFCIAVAAR
jgi:hypothetical protein